MVIIKENVQIYEYVSIGKATIIGENSIIGYYANLGLYNILMPNTKIGTSVKIQNGNIFMGDNKIGICEYQFKDDLAEKINWDFYHYKTFVSNKFHQWKSFINEQRTVIVGGHNIFYKGSSVGDYVLIEDFNIFEDNCVIMCFNQISSFILFKIEYVSYEDSVHLSNKVVSKKYPTYEENQGNN